MGGGLQQNHGKTSQFSRCHSRASEADARAVGAELPSPMGAELPSPMGAELPSPQTVRLSRSVVPRASYSSTPGLAHVLLNDGITARICTHLRLEHLAALAEASAAAASQVGKRILDAQFWTERDPAEEGDFLGNLLCAVTMRLTPADVKATMLSIEATLMAFGESRGRLYKWFVLLERPRALSRHLGHLVYRSAAAWRPSDLAELFWAFFPADNQYPTLEAAEDNPENLANEFVQFCRSARIRAAAGRCNLTTAIRAILQVDDDSREWAPDSKAAFVLCLLLQGHPPPGCLDPSTLFSIADVVPMGIQFGLLGDDLDALSRLVEAFEAELIEVEHDGPAGTIDGEGDAASMASAGEMHLEGHGSVISYHEEMTLDELHAQYTMWLSKRSCAHASDCIRTGAEVDSAGVLPLPRLKEVHLEAFTKVEFPCRPGHESP
jgi:hypothetical protein